MERITSARDLSRYLAERFRRDGFVGPGVKVEKGELILPIGPELERFCGLAALLRQKCDKAATSSHHDFADAVTSMHEDAILFGSPMDSAVAGFFSMIRKEQAMRVTYVPDDPATFFAKLNFTTDDWRSITENALKAERKANRARERALKRSHRNTKNPKKKGKRR